LRQWEIGGEVMSKGKMPEEEMNDRYLWDGSGEPNAEVLRLEKSLVQFRHKGSAPAFPTAMPFREEKSLLSFLQLLWARRLAAVAAMAVVAVTTAVLISRPRTPAAPRPGWEVARVAGSPTIGARTISETNKKGKLEVGQLLITNGDSRASITVAEIGQVDVDPGSRVRLLQTSRDRKRISLEQGTIHAAIWAPPGEFVVDTPSAVAVDLGCVYTLHVNADGSGILRTTLGWVGFQLEGRESFIPAGAMCPTRPKLGPGTPYFEDASESFRAALTQLDFDAQSSEARAVALRTALSQARKEDALSLWHLLARTSGAEREEVFDRFAALLPPPAGVTREGILRLDRQQMDLWWNQLGVGDISIWRFWEQSEQPGGLSPSHAQSMQKKQAILKQSR
jgi:hypothetical protein